VARLDFQAVVAIDLTPSRNDSEETADER